MDDKMKRLNELKVKFQKASYIKKQWKTSPEDVFSLKDYAEYVEPSLNHIAGEPVIVSKEKKDGSTFLKLSIPLEGNDEFEYELSYHHAFEEGDTIDANTITFCIEKWYDREHYYATGKII